MTSKPLIHVCIAFALLAAALGGYAFWYLRVEAASVRAAELSSEIDSTTANVERIKSASQALVELEKDERTVNAYFVRGSDVVSFLEYLESAGDPFGASVEVVSVSSDQKTPRGRLSVSIRITGAFDGVVRTLGRIEYAPYDMQVGNATFDASEGATWTAVAVLSVGMKSATTTAARP